MSRQIYLIRHAMPDIPLTVLEEENGALRVRVIGLSPQPELTDELCLAMLDASGADEARVAHYRAVAALADELCTALKDKGIPLDSEAIHTAALLHDIAKGERDHAALGGIWLKELDYPELAEIVRQHTEPDSDALNEAGLVFLADKLVRGERRVALAERFGASLAKCTSPEAQAAHARRFALARSLKEKIDRLSGAEFCE